MSARYHCRERIFTGCGPNLVESEVVFGVDDLTEDECHTLSASVQHGFDELHRISGMANTSSIWLHPPKRILRTFINLKAEWDRLKRELGDPESASRRSVNSEIRWFYDVAREHADIIRGMRKGRIRSVYLQCDVGDGFETFDCVESLTEDEIETLEAVLDTELHDLGMVLRVISDWDADRNPAIYVKATLSWNRFEETVKHDEADETRMTASRVSYECIEEIKRLRLKPAIFEPDESQDDFTGDVEPTESEDGRIQRNGDANAPTPEPRQADESLRSDYRDPDNYWRNVWLYELRAAGKNNATILKELASRGQEFAPIDSENALRTAIDSIAQYHDWPTIKGKPGRPKAKPQSAGKPLSETAKPRSDRD